MDTSAIRRRPCRIIMWDLPGISLERTESLEADTTKSDTVASESDSVNASVLVLTKRKPDRLISTSGAGKSAFLNALIGADRKPQFVSSDKWTWHDYNTGVKQISKVPRVADSAGLRTDNPLEHKKIPLMIGGFHDSREAFTPMLKGFEPDWTNNLFLEPVCSRKSSLINACVSMSSYRKTECLPKDITYDVYAVSKQMPNVIVVDTPGLSADNSEELWYIARRERLIRVPSKVWIKEQTTTHSVDQLIEFFTDHSIGIFLQTGKGWLTRLPIDLMSLMVSFHNDKRAKSTAKNKNPATLISRCSTRTYNKRLKIFKEAPRYSREEVEEMERINRCKICLDNDACVIFLPCSHMVACEMCASILKRCAMCRSLIYDTFKVNLQ